MNRIQEMDSTSRRSRRVTAAGVLVALAVGIGACANPPTQVDPGFFPEGKLSPNARLIMWNTEPNVVTVYDDLPPLGASPFGDRCGLPTKGFEDTLLGTTLESAFAPGTIRGFIIDGTPAGGFQMFRRESNGGFRQFQDFLAERFRRWLPTGWEAYRFTDPTPSGLTPASYVGRGVVAGTVTPQSPLTNAVELTLPSVPDIALTSPRRPPDSLFTTTWEAVTGATGYWLQIYELPAVSPNEAILRGAPAPLFDGSNVDEVFTGFVQAPSTTYKLGDTSRSDVDIFIRNSPFFSRIYVVRITAVDATGQMLATTRGSNGILFGDGIYGLFPLGGVGVCPTPPGLAIESEGGAGAPILAPDGRVAWRVSHLPYVPK